MIVIILIGATVYIATEEFDKCITDCDRAIELNNKFIKVNSGFIIWLMITIPKPNITIILGIL